jgi:PadR family transcriptional regulator
MIPLPEGEDMKNEKNDLLPGTLDMLILKTLKTRGPMHGYGIAQYIQQVSDDVLQVDEGSLYPALQRLLMQDWVAAEWGHSANHRRARFYRLTPAGRRQLEREVSSFDRLIEAIGRVIRPAEES